MEKCHQCKIKYPDGYTSSIISSEGASQFVCGICALEISNKVLGIKRTKFTGEIAEEMRQKAINWCKKHGK